MSTQQKSQQSKNTAGTSSPESRQSLVTHMAQKFGVDPDKMLVTLKATAFRQTRKDGSPIEVTNEQMMSLLVVAKEYNLNPWTREIFAFPDKAGGIVPVISIDGWDRIVNEHPQLASFSFEYPDVDDDVIPSWIACTITRRDRDKPVSVREYFDECKRDTPAWTSHPRRMLRHKAFIQCARLAFGFAGVHDPDEAERIIEAQFAAQPERRRPQSVDAEPVRATTDQLTMVLDAVKEAGNTESDPRGDRVLEELLKHFGIPALEALPFDKVADALAWLRR
jgi:phage recombination protein Bet